MRVTTSKSKNSESFYITQSYTSAQGKSTSKTIRKLGTLADLSKQLHTDREGVLAWANEQARLETLKYKSEKEDATVMIPFHSNRFMDYHKQKLFSGGYLFLQSIYYGLKMDSICRKIKSRHKFEYDLNAILSDLIYTRVLEPSSKSSSFRAAKQFLEPPTYELHDVYRALSVLASEMDFIQSEVYKNSHLLGKRNDAILYYDCTNYFFEIEQEDGDRKYGKGKEHRPNPIIQMGMFMDGDGIPLAFSLFPGNANEQTSLKPLEGKVLQDFGCTKFIYCSDAGLGSEAIKKINHAGERAFIVTQSIKKLNKDDKKWALDKTGFKRVSDDMPVELSEIPEDDNGLYYKDEPYTPHTLHQRLIVPYSPKFARYQKTIRDLQVERAKKMLQSGNIKKERRNPNDPARFIGKTAVTEDGEAADIRHYLDTDKIEDEALYDGMYAVTTDLLDDDVKDILKVSEGRWEIEECFRIMKTDFEARPVFVHADARIRAHFLICFLSLVIYRYLEKDLGQDFTCEMILDKLKSMNFANIQDQGFIPLYTRDRLTDSLHKICGFDTDFKFITKSQMKTIQKKSKGRE